MINVYFKKISGTTGKVLFKPGNILKIPGKISDKTEYDDVEKAAPKKGKSLMVCLPAAAVAESAAVIPIFVFAVVSLISIIIIMGTMARVRKTMFESIREAEAIPYVLEEGVDNNTGLKSYATLAKIKSGFVRKMTEGGDKGTRITGGASGVDFVRSVVFKGDAGMFIKADYKIKLIPILFEKAAINTSVEMQSYAWMGEDYMKKTGSTDDRIVYMTPHGEVYHEDKNCTYLSPRVFEEPRASIGEKRNADGEIYRVCSACDNQPGGEYVYITEYGNRYHTSGNCKKIQHEIISVPLSEAGNIRKCSKEAGAGS